MVYTFLETMFFQSGTDYWTQLSVSLTNRNCSIAIMLTFDSVFHYLVSHYWVPQCPPYYMYGNVIIPSW